MKQEEWNEKLKILMLRGKRNRKGNYTLKLFYNTKTDIITYKPG